MSKGIPNSGRRDRTAMFKGAKVCSESAIKTIGKRIATGILNGICGSLVYWILIVVIACFRDVQLDIAGNIVYGLLGMATASFYVLPLGGILGVILPRVVRACSRRSAIIRCVVFGFFAGIIVALLTISVFHGFYFPNTEESHRRIREQFVYFMFSMVPFCALWVGIWGSRTNAKMIRQRDAGAPLESLPAQSRRDDRQ